MKHLNVYLRSCPLFEGVAEENLTGMLGCLGARTVEVQKDEPVFSEGDPARYLGIVLTGAVHLVREDYYGNRSILAHIGPAQMFGEAFAFSGAEFLPVGIVADADSKLLLLDSRRIGVCCSHACEFHSRVIYNLLRIVAGNNLILHQKIYVTSMRTTREKLMAYLLNEAKLHNSNSFEIPYDRQELADYLEVDRSGLSAEISKLRREGLLESERHRFTLKRGM